MRRSLSPAISSHKIPSLFAQRYFNTQLLSWTREYICAKSRTTEMPHLRQKFLEIATLRRLALNTRKAYARWIKELLRFTHPRRPALLTSTEVASFLTFLVNSKAVSAPNSTVEGGEAKVVEERFAVSMEIDAEFMELNKAAKCYSGKLKVAEICNAALKEYVEWVRLQFDHLKPYACGRENSAENLRLLCPAYRTPLCGENIWTEIHGGETGRWID